MSISQIENKYVATQLDITEPTLVITIVAWDNEKKKKKKKKKKFEEIYKVSIHALGRIKNSLIIQDSRSDAMFRIVVKDAKCARSFQQKLHENKVGL